MKKILIIPVILLLSLILLVLPTAAKNSAQPAGWIDGFNGEPKDYKLLRDGKEIAVEFFLPLYNGDRLSVTQNSVNMRIGSSGNKINILKKENGELLIKAAKRTPKLATNIMKWAGQWFTSLSSGRADTTAVALVTRGDMSYMNSPMLMNWENRICAGERDFYLSWQGGAPPFEIILKQGNIIIKRADNIDSNQIRFENLKIDPGNYDLVIIDTKGYNFIENFAAVPHALLPIMPDELQQTDLPKNLVTTLFAAWLITQDDNAWTLEAYQQVAPLSEKYVTANFLQRAITSGRYISITMP